LLLKLNTQITYRVNSLLLNIIRLPDDKNEIPSVPIFNSVLIGKIKKNKRDIKSTGKLVSSHDSMKRLAYIKLFRK